MAAARASTIGGMDASTVNIAAYRFVALDRLERRRQELRSLCIAQGLRGTILLSGEGINLFLSGSSDATEALTEHLERDTLLAGMTIKRSFSCSHPFARLKVKLKREIIPFGVEGVDPVRHATSTVAPEALRDWLREGRAVTLLDVRNAYEIDYGTFAGAQSLKIRHFRQLPAAIEQLDATLHQRPLVMFCTGGIRCEKAGLYMQQRGFRDVYQLEGGILHYFARCGGEYFQGNCFVFDERIALDPDLRPVEPGAAAATGAERPSSPPQQD